MKAYKFLGAGGVGRFSRFRWPAPGAWVEVAGATLDPCRNGIHACRVEQLPYWLDEELVEVELGGEVVDGPQALIASRARIVRRYDEWPAVRKELAADCASRVARRTLDDGLTPRQREVAAILVGEVATLASRGSFVTAAYVAAVHGRIRAAAADADAGELEERRAQTHFIVERLGLR